MKINREWAVRRCVTFAVVVAGLSTPLLAAAQFAVVTQTGTAVAQLGSYSAKPKSAEPGVMTSFNLWTETGVREVSYAASGASTTIGADRIGIFAGAGAAVTSSGRASHYPYEVLLTAPAYGEAAASVTFDLMTDTDVLMSGNDHYLNESAYVAGLSPKSSFTSSLSLSKVGPDGQLTSVAPRENLFEITHLEAGRYVLSSSFMYKLDVPSGLAGGGAELTISVVPEPGAMGLMGVGLGGMLLAIRRRRGRDAV